MDRLPGGSLPLDAFDVGVLALLLLDAEGRVVRQSRGWSAALDWPGSVVGRSFLSLFAPDHGERVARALKHAIPDAPPTVVRARALRPGEPTRLTLRLEAHEGGFLVAAEDSGEKAVVLEGSSSFQTLVDFASDVWLVHDLEGRIRDANAYACQNLGYTREEILALKVADIETTIQPGRLDGVWNRMELGRPVTVQGRQRRKDGSTYPVEVRLGLFETSDDEVLMLAVARDVTERERQQRRLRELNEALERQVAERTAELADALVERQAIVDHLAHGLLAVGPEGRIRLANPAVADLVGPLCMAGADATQVLPEALLQLFDRTLDGPRTCEFALADGGIGLATASALPDGGMVMSLRDVSLEREVDRMKTDFIATVSHELRTPLTSVLGFAKLTASRLEERIFPLVEAEADRRLHRTVGQLRKNLGIIVTEGQRLTQLINDVLDISKMEAGRMEWSMGTVEVGALLEQVEATSQALFDSPEVALVLACPDGLPDVRGDADRLVQVLLNLVSNARKFTARGEVTLGARPCADGVELYVTDTGTGIPDDQLDAIFDRFQQLGDTLTDKPRGTGLGLPICQQIAAAHGSTITVRSRLGEGSRFALVLPLEATDRPRRPAPAGLDRLVSRIDALRPAGRRGEDILVVDDDPHLRELLRQQLTGQGYRVRLAADGVEAIDAVRAKAPDLVVLDIMMPRLSGFDVAALLKNDPATQSIPILVLSIVRDDERGLRLGVDRYLSKPIQEDTLIAAVEELLARTHTPRRVLLVEHATPVAADVQRLLEAKGFAVVGSCSGHEALAHARDTRPDLILLDAAGPHHEELLRTIRFERGLEHVVVVQLMEP